VGTVSAQEPSAIHERTGAPADSRFEIVQSTLVARSTYRLDKLTGRVDQIVMRADSTLTWQVIPRLEHSVKDPQLPGRVNYQLFLSGIANRHTYLLNTNSGATWQLVLTRDNDLVWSPIE
jgi:hypothetical protein